MQIVITNIQTMITSHYQRVSQQFINRLITNLSEKYDYLVTVEEDETNGFNTANKHVVVTEALNRG